MERNKAIVMAYNILLDLQVAGRSWIVGGNEALDRLHQMGMDNDTIMRMQRQFKKDPGQVRMSLEEKLIAS